MAKKFDVIGVDHDQKRISQLNQGKPPIHERGLRTLLNAGLAKGSLAFHSDYDFLQETDVIFIAVGTPSKPDGSIDLSQVSMASEAIGNQLAASKRRSLVVVKSTVTPGTTVSIVKPALERASGRKCGGGFGLCSNPEFLREGAAIEDTLHPDRIVVGPTERASGIAVTSLFRKFYGNRLPPMVMTTPENAELIKYASNTFLATKISFINFVARICETLPGTDVNQVAYAMGLDPRIGNKYLQAGPGFGGSCFPKDSQALSAFAAQRGVDDSILRSVMGINDTQPDWILSRLEGALGGIDGKNIAILGVAFKEDSDDVRESRSIVLAKRLLVKGARVRMTDPKAISGARKELGGRGEYFEDPRDCIRDSDAAVVMTAWGEFRSLQPADFIKLMRTPVLFDARRIYDAEKYGNGVPKFMAVGLGKMGA